MLTAGIMGPFLATLCLSFITCKVRIVQCFHPGYCADRVRQRKLRAYLRAPPTGAIQ